MDDYYICITIMPALRIISSKVEYLLLKNLFQLLHNNMFEKEFFLNFNRLIIFVSYLKCFTIYCLSKKY